MSSRASVISLGAPPSRSSVSDDNSSTATVDKINAFEVYAPETKTMYAVPRKHIVHFGTNSSGKLLLCKTISNNPTALPLCPEGSQCRYVHIDVPLNQLKGDIIHVHYIYRDADLCPYERLSTVMAREQTVPDQKAIDDLTLMIYGPNNREPVERIPVTQLLLTGGSRYAYDCAVNPRRGANGQPAEPPRVCHCAHYYFTQTCNRGANCSFIHVVSIDPTQKADSTKPTNYRRRVGQLGQSEVPQMAMTPQVAYHTPMGSQANTPLTGPHIGRSPGPNQHSSPFLQNARSPCHPNNKTPFNSTSSPFLPAEGNNTISYDSYNNSANQPNIVNGNQPHASNGYNTRSPPMPNHLQNNTTKATSVYVGHRPQQPLESVYLPREQVTVGVKAPHQSHFPPSPTVQQHQTTKQLPTSMLPMDDVEEEGAADQHTASGYPASYNYHSTPDFTLGTKNTTGSSSYYTEGYSSNNAEFAQKHQYTSSNKASPIHTPSTAMHMPTTPKVSAGRYAHNPYAGSPVTAQNTV